MIAKQNIHNLIWLVFCLSVYLLSGCACSSAADNQTARSTDTLNIPADIVQKGDLVIIKKTGSAFFQKYIELNKTKVMEIPDGYYLSYNFRITGKDYVNEEITLVVDKKGIPKQGYEISGIPDCVSDTCYAVTKEKAVDIARAAGMKQGIKDWEENFDWDSSQDRYIWTVRSTLSESAGSNGKRGTGEKIIIDPNSGAVLLKTDWKIF